MAAAINNSRKNAVNNDRGEEIRKENKAGKN